MGLDVVQGGLRKKEVIQEYKHIGRNVEVTNNIPLSALILEAPKLARRNMISLEAAEALYNTNNNQDLVEFISHNSMVELSREALAGEWPPNDSPVDHCATDDETPTKRPAADDVFNDPGSGSERMMKRVKQ